MSRVSLLSHYQILGVDRQASDDEVRSAYRRMARRYHPDRFQGSGDSQETMARINTAYDVLSDFERRTEYNRLTDAEYAASAAERTRAGIAAQRLLGIPNWSWYLLLGTLTLTVLAVSWLSLRTLAPRQPALRATQVALPPSQAVAVDSLSLVPARRIQSWTEPERVQTPLGATAEPALHLVGEGSMKMPPAHKGEGGMSSD